MKQFILQIALFSLFLVSCTGEPMNAQAQVQPFFSVIQKNADDQIVIEYKDKTTILDIHSPSGIGSAKLTLASGDMPESIMLRLHLKGLEAFHLISTQDHIAVSVSSSAEGNAQSQRDLSGNREQAIGELDTQWVAIEIKSKSTKIPLIDGYFEIIFPKSFIQQSDQSFEIQWVDFFR